LWGSGGKGTRKIKKVEGEERCVEK